MFCIRCSTEMKHKVLNGVLLDHCPNCRGIWLDGGELRKINTGVIASYVKLKRQARAEKKRDEERQVALPGFIRGECQRCGDLLRTGKKHGVVYEYCKACGGTFFDYRELDAMLENRTSVEKFCDFMTGLFRD